MRRTAFKKKPNKNFIPQESKDAVYARSHGRCEFIDPETEQRCTWMANRFGPHHIERRRNKDHSPGNLMDLCGYHHSQVHENPEWAYEHGYMIRSNGRSGKSVLFTELEDG